MNHKRAAIFLNPHSGSSSWSKKLNIARNASRKIKKLTGSEVIIYSDQVNSREEFQKLLRKESPKYKYVIVGGGDGTFNDALNYTPENVILGFIPLGTGNALKFALDNSNLNMKNCSVDVILDKEDNKKCFIYGMGMDGFVTKHSEKLRNKGFKSPLRYVHSVLVATLGKFKPVNFKVRKDNYLNITFKNNSFCFI